jgi:hypothetical protein
VTDAIDLRTIGRAIDDAVRAATERRRQHDRARVPGREWLQGPMPDPDRDLAEAVVAELARAGFEIRRTA